MTFLKAVTVKKISAFKNKKFVVNLLRIFF